MTRTRITWIASVAFLVAGSTSVFCNPVQGDETRSVRPGEMLTLSATVADCQNSLVIWKYFHNGVVMECEGGKVTLHPAWGNRLQKVPGSCCSMSVLNVSGEDPHQKYTYEIYDVKSNLIVVMQFRVMLRDDTTTTTSTTTISTTPTTTATLTTITPPTSKSPDPKISTFGIAGIAVFAVIAVIGLVLWKRRSDQKYEQPPENQETIEMSTV